ncbi:MAG: type I-U CRISPR-associated protein Csx17 [Chthoniobacterales bacterium]|nr:type I-U CRISPR-associated protein Csx17 [Chthoniobacterales bacterium]
MPSLILTGCAPVPIAHYLKALGILRLVSEQCDQKVLGQWNGNAFKLTSILDRESLLTFFLETYKPTPIIAPWNGGSGFFPNDNKEGIEPIRATKSQRFASFQEAVNSASECLAELGLTEKPGKDVKEALLMLCRNRSPEHALEWLDSAFVLTGDGAKYPPLLGTGGNDGRLEFTNNFMQRLAEVFDLPDGTPAKMSEKWLDNALFGTALPVLGRGAIGQFSPGAGGGANASSGFDSHSSTNPWDFILMLEGAILFAGAAVKRLESAEIGQLVYPFCVKQAGVGYGSAALLDETNSRCEMWMPLWEQPVALSELKALLGEGRAQVGGRSARNGVDFARAVATLGVDRGISAFQRYGFQVRNGLAYFATPLERVVVRRNRLASQLLAPIDDWLEKFRRAARADVAPSSIQRAARALEAAIVAFCKTADARRVQELLISLGDCEAAMAGRWKWSRQSYLSPVPLLATQWLREANTGTVEFRLAAALAGVTSLQGRDALWLRSHLEPVRPKGGREKRWFEWTDTIETNVVWRGGDLAQTLNAIIARRLLSAGQSSDGGYPDSSKISARPAAIAAFIEGRTDDRLLSRLLWGLMLIDFGGKYSDDFKIGFPTEHREPPALYALLKLCFTNHKVRDIYVPLVPAIHRRARAGDGLGASILAARRLLGSSLAPAIDRIPASGPMVVRAAAALLFPVTENDLGEMAGCVLRPKQSEPKSTPVNI